MVEQIEYLEEIKLVMVDSCVLLSAILEEGLTAKCQDSLNCYLKNNQYKLCFTPIVITEVINKIFKESEKELQDRRPTLNPFSEKIKWDNITSHLAAFSEISKNYKVLYFNEGDYLDVLDKTKKLRLGINIDKDRINIATAISHNCSEFITIESNIWKERNAIQHISNGKLEIVRIN